MKKMRFLRVASILAFATSLVLVSTGHAEAQCAMCRSALLDSPEGQQMASGFNTAILFLLGAPYLVFGTLAGSIWWTRHRRRSEAS